jgi:hypothetical protein
MHESNCFITLTYDDQHVKPSLNKRDFQLFIKRLRKTDTLRYYMCGEYGELNQRPHFHACLFGTDFPDKTLHSTNNGYRLYRSPRLEKLWHYGYSTIGAVTFETAAYVARYIIAKINGDLAPKHYEHLDLETGELTQRLPEYTNMSLKPGIGASWYDQYKTDVYPDGIIIARGHSQKAPPFYDKRYKNEDREAYENLLMQREEYAKSHAADNTTERLNSQHIINLARIKLQRRKLGD